MYRFASLSLALFFLCGSAMADELTLEDGSVLKGKVVEERGKLYLVDRDHKFSILQKAGRTFVYRHNDKGARRKVAVKSRVSDKNSFMDQYERRMEKLNPKDAEAIFAFGKWVAENDWPTRAHQAFLQVLDQDPDHRGARRALGYKLYEGEWVSPTELNRKKGLVEFEGRWYTKHDLAELQKKIQQNKDLQMERENRLKVQRYVNSVVRRFQTFDKKQRQEAYEDLRKYADRIGSPRLRKFADDVKAWYDYQHKVLCAQMKTRAQINATLTKLKKPIDAFETLLGAAIAFVSSQSPVKIQLPELSIAQVQTTAEIPSGCH